MGGKLHNHGVIDQDGVDIDISADVTIGEGAVISEYVTIYTHDHDPRDLTRTHATPLVIGAGAWVGAHSIILPQVTSIGERAVIGAGSVVTKNVPAGELWAGNPAVKRRDL